MPDQPSPPIVSPPSPERDTVFTGGPAFSGGLAADPANARSAKYSFSWNEENYYGEYPSVEAATAEAFAERPDASHCYIGEAVTPIPEHFIRAEDVIEHIICQDEFSGDWAENWPHETKAQRDELTEEFRKVFGAWLDRHDLRPTFFNIENARRVENPKFQPEGGVA